MAKRKGPGRFVTLQSGRVIFIPKGYKSKWADVRDKVLVDRKAGREPGKLAGLVPEANLKNLTLGEGGGLYGATTAEGKVDTFAYHPRTGKLLAGGPWDYAMHDALIEEYGEGRHYDEWVKATVDLNGELVVFTERFEAADPAGRFNRLMRTARALRASGFPDDTPLVLTRGKRGAFEREWLRDVKMPLGNVG